VVGRGKFVGEFVFGWGVVAEGGVSSLVVAVDATGATSMRCSERKDSASWKKSRSRRGPVHLAGMGVEHGDLPGPCSLQLVRIPSHQRAEVLRDGIGVPGGIALATNQLSGRHEVRKPRRRNPPVVVPMG
jgi:hypothetical protein